MREQRLDQEDIVGDITKNCEGVKKEQEMLKQKLKRVEQSLTATENDIRDFQREKQARLNEIEVMVMLYAHQIEYLEDDCLPADMSNAVLFSNEELARLRRRIDVCLFFSLSQCCSPGMVGAVVHSGQGAGVGSGKAGDASNSEGAQEAAPATDPGQGCQRALTFGT